MARYMVCTFDRTLVWEKNDKTNNVKFHVTYETGVRREKKNKFKLS